MLSLIFNAKRLPQLLRNLVFYQTFSPSKFSIKLFAHSICLYDRNDSYFDTFSIDWNKSNLVLLRRRSCFATHFRHLEYLNNKLYFKIESDCQKH
jgi:hypothetical protein